MKNEIVSLIIAVFLVGTIISVSCTMDVHQVIPSYGQIDYSTGDFLSEIHKFHSGKGIGGVLGGEYSRDNIWFCRMQLFAEIDNTATDPMEVLVPNGASWAPGGDHYSEGGVDYYHLLRNLAYCFDRGMVAHLSLWITNIDPLDARLTWEDYGYEEPSIAPKLPVANINGYTTFLTALNDWILENYPDSENAYVLWEPCWEFNLYPWTNWGGAGGNRLWAIYSPYYENAMSVIRSVLDTLPNRRIFLVSHIIPWHADSWQARGKPRITGDNIGYLHGIQKCDFLTISLYVEIEDWVPHGTDYLDWVFENVVKQIALDQDVSEYGCEFLGTSEYNIGGIEYGSPDDYLLFIEYSYDTIVPQYFDYFRMFGWWMPFNTQQELDTWKYWSSQYDGWTP